ncbi:MAG: hypothetical protein ACRCST_03690 [Turicibacter sp.]
MDNFQKKNGFKIIRKMNSFEYVKDHAPNKVGVYVMNLNGKVMFVGRGCEEATKTNAKGLRKMLQDHWTGNVLCKEDLHIHKDQITIKVRVCQTIEEAIKLEQNLIHQYDTKHKGWNI